MKMQNEMLMYFNTFTSYMTQCSVAEQWALFGFHCDLQNVFFHLQQEDMHLCLPSGYLVVLKWSKSVQNKWPKGRVVFLPLYENSFALFGGTSKTISSPNFYVIRFCCFSLIFRVLSKSVKVWYSYSRKKTFRGLPK